MTMFLENSVFVWFHSFKEFVSLTIVAMEIGKIRFFSYHNNGCCEGKSMKNLNGIHLNYHWKNWVDWIKAGWYNMSQPQKCAFLEKGLKC